MRWWRSHGLFVATGIAVWLFLFWPFLSGQSLLGYRDSSHLYYPLFDYIQSQWRDGTIPLWNPLDDFGAPLVGDGISSVFYPLKVLFFLPGVPYAVQFALFVSVHVLIAMIGTYVLSRRLFGNPYGAALAAFGFALSGAFLFQVCNVVYLVGAAWLPWSLASGWAAIGSTRLSAISLCGLFTALMILGGDPQMAYHSMLILGMTALVTFVADLRAKAVAGRKPLGAFFGIVMCVIVLSAVQWMPTSRWYARSSRASSGETVSIWGLAGRIASGKPVGPRDLFAPAPPESHRAHAYEFSQPPWSVAELIWPNFSGKEFPLFRRWTAGIPAADRVWTPSIYMGLPVLVFALAGMRFRGMSAPTGLTWIALLFGLGSLGWYGLGWITREVAAAVHSESFQSTSPPLFGVYWWMTVLLPGYAGFRYPAKLFVVATLAIAVLGGWQLARKSETRDRRINRWLNAILVLSVIGLALSIWPPIKVWFHGIGADATFGPFDPSGSLHDFQRSIIHGFVLAGGLKLLVGLFSSNRLTENRFFVLIVALSLVDMCQANSWLIVDVPADQIALHSPIETPSANDLASKRVLAPVNQPNRFATENSPQRLVEVVVHERTKLFPKFHLLHRVGSLGSFHAMEPLDLAWFYDVIPPSAELTDLPRVAFVNTWKPPHFSRQTTLPVEMEQEFKQIVAEDFATLTSSTTGSTGRTHRVHDLGIYDNSVSLLVECDSPTWVVLQDYWDEGWAADYTEDWPFVDDAIVHRFCGIWRAIYLPRAGQFEIQFHYRPASFSWGLAISTLGGLGLAVLFIVRLFIARLTIVRGVTRHAEK